LHIYNRSIQSGNVRTNLKIAKVIPLYKNGEHTEPSNYRTISLLSIFSKLFEKCVCRRQILFLDKYHTIYDFQFGFRRKQSTTLALIDVIDNI